MPQATAPDYANPTHWLIAPSGPGILPASSRAMASDVFYIHPTTADGPDWNQTFAATHPDSRNDQVVLLRQLDAFAPAGRLFAPRYRQATSLAFRDPGPAADAAYALAYDDIHAAFRHYLRHDNAGRGFILCGHSQGALHVSRLLAEVIEIDGLHRQLIAAYVIGIGLSQGLFGTGYRDVQPCLHPAQTGCVVSYNCLLPSADAGGFQSRTLARDTALLRGATAGAPLCLNPLSFDAARPTVPAAENPGTMPAGTPSEPLPALIPGLAGAHCAAGIAWVFPAPAPGHGLTPLPGGNMHMHEIALFHAALQADSARRAAAYARVTPAAPDA